MPRSASSSLDNPEQHDEISVGILTIPKTTRSYNLVYSENIDDVVGPV
jgi:hypothetical protein